MTQENLQQIPAQRPDPALEAAFAEYVEQIAIATGRAATYRAQLANAQQKIAAQETEIRDLKARMAGAES